MVRTGSNSPDTMEMVSRLMKDAGRSLLRIAHMQNTNSLNQRRREFVESIGKFQEKGGNVLDVYRQMDDEMDAGDCDMGAVWEEEIPGDFLQRYEVKTKKS